MVILRSENSLNKTSTCSVYFEMIVLIRLQEIGSTISCNGEMAKSGRLCKHFNDFIKYGFI